MCAHRGLWGQTGSHRNPDYAGIAENTIAAYEKAIDNPYIDWIEFDARRTSDGVFVAWHDPDVWRITNKFDDSECIPIDSVNLRDRLYLDQHRTWRKQVKEYTWNEMKDLHLRDYLGCKVKDEQGNYVHPLKLEDAFQWVKDQAAQGKYTALSIDYKDGLNYLDDLYRLILEYDLEGQVLFSVYARDYALADYQAEYGKSFLKQLPLKPTFYEPTEPSQYGGSLSNRFNEYLNTRNSGHTLAAVTLNVNSNRDHQLINLVRSNPFPTDSIWYISHYLEPYMVSIYDNLRITTSVDCDPNQHTKTEACANLFWRADFDWLLNNGTNGIFSDNPEPLIEYLIAKGKKNRH